MPENLSYRGRRLGALQLTGALQHPASGRDRSALMSAVAVTKRGSAAELHALDFTAGERGELWVMEPAAPALVLGSAQRAEVVDTEALAADGVQLAERRTGGGAVFINPAGVAWIDVLARRGSRWWSDDLVANFELVGERWLAALRSCGVADARLCERAEPRTAASAAACWVGHGWGEILIGDHKIVGLSQRRNRWGARVQAMAVLDGSAARVLDYLRPAPELDFEAMAAAIGEPRPPVAREALISAVLEAFG